MKVKFRTSLGTLDARPLGLDHTKCKDGSVLDVDQKVGEELVKRGIAEETTEAVHEELRGVAPKAAIAEPAKPATFGKDPHATDPHTKK